jgi:hypothetical protein
MNNASCNYTAAREHVRRPSDIAILVWGNWHGVILLLISYRYSFSVVLFSSGFTKMTTKRRRKRTSVEYCVKYSGDKYSGDAILCAVVGFAFG